VLLKPTPFSEDAAGYEKLFDRLGSPADTLVAMEATGHYWKNLFAALAARGFAVALLNPLRTHRFAGEELQRTQTDAIDALGIARFAAQKRPLATRLPDRATEELRELVRYRDRLVQDFGDRVRQLHRLVDLGFPEFTRYVRDLASELATAILRDYPTAVAFQGIALRRLAACVTTAGTAWAMSSPRPCWRRPRAPSGVTTARPTGSRSASPVRISTSCAGACAIWRATSSACWMITRWAGS
jgi:transposase